jgi:hypothetical protein
MKAAIILCFALAAPLLTGSVSTADCVRRALEGLEAGVPGRAVPALKIGMRRGNVLCQYILGMWTLSGIGVELDPVTGSRWLRQATQEAAAFRPKRLSNRTGWSRRDVLRLMGVRGHPNEYDRLFD